MNVANAPDVVITNTESDPVPVTVQDSTQTAVEWRFKAFSTTTTTGEVVYGVDSGIFAMHAICAAEVPDSRACFSSEVAASGNIPDGSRGGWVIPTDIQLIQVEAVSPERWLAMDSPTGAWRFSVAPVSAMQALTCDSWRSSATSGTVVVGGDFRGSIGTNVCATDRHIACCAPMAIPVSE